MDARIDRLQRIAADSPHVLALGGGLPADELFPREQLAEAFLSALRQPHCAALQYGWPEGDSALREWIAARLRARGADVQAADVIVTSGAQQAIAIAAERLTCEGARVRVDRECYPAALDLFRASGARLFSGSERADFSYAMPGIANPHGNTMPETERIVLLGSGRPIIADEAYAELRFDGRLDRPLLADARDRTWHVGTLSKTLCPGLRVGWLVPPPAEHRAALDAKRDRDLQAGSLAQAVVRAFLERDDFDARLERARSFYEARAGRLVAALRRRFPSFHFREPEGGFSIFVETDLDGDDAALLECAAHQGIAFDPGRLFRLTEAASPIGMRLCYSSASGDELEEAVARLERAVRLFTKKIRGSRTDLVHRAGLEVYGVQRS